MVVVQVRDEHRVRVRPVLAPRRGRHGGAAARRAGAAAGRSASRTPATSSTTLACPSQRGPHGSWAQPRRARPSGPAGRAPPRRRRGSRVPPTGSRRSSSIVQSRRVQQQRVVLRAADPAVRADLPLERVHVALLGHRRDEQQVPGVRQPRRTRAGPRGRAGRTARAGRRPRARRRPARAAPARAAPIATSPRPRVSTTTTPTPGRAASPATSPGHRSCRSSSVSRCGTCGNHTRPRFPEPTTTTSGRLGSRRAGRVRPCSRPARGRRPRGPVQRAGEQRVERSPVLARAALDAVGRARP